MLMPTRRATKSPRLGEGACENAEVIRHDPLEMRDTVVDRRIEDARRAAGVPGGDRARAAFVQADAVVDAVADHRLRQFAERRPVAVAPLLAVDDDEEQPAALGVEAQAGA